MRHNNLARELSLILLMTENRGYTVRQLCDRLGISRRSLYYYIDFLRDYGFVVEKHGACYSLDKTSPFFTKLIKKAHFTEDEAIVMRRLLDGADSASMHVEHLRRKLANLYAGREPEAQNVSTLYEAIKQKKAVILRNYSSPHSDSVSNRVVEPYLFLDNNNEVRCYEYKSAMNKTFKISRIEEVMMLSDDWTHEAAHHSVYTDIFMFSGEATMPVELRLNRLAGNLLLEEYPRAGRYVTPDGPSHWVLRLDVCSYLGVSRFVLGLFESVEVLGDDRFREFVRAKIACMKL